MPRNKALYVKANGYKDVVSNDDSTAVGLASIYDRQQLLESAET